MRGTARGLIFLLSSFFFLWGTSCLPLNRSNPTDPQSGSTSAIPPLLVLDDCEDQDRQTSQGPGFLWTLRSDQELVFQGGSSASPLDSASPYMTGSGYASGVAFQAAGALALEIFPGSNLATPYYGFVRAEADLRAGASLYSELSFAIRSDPASQALTLTTGLFAQDGDFFSWTESIPPAGIPAWEIRTLKLKDALAEPSNFHREAGRGSKAAWPGPEPSDFTRVFWLLYGEGPTFGTSVPYSIFLDAIELR